MGKDTLSLKSIASSGGSIMVSAKDIDVLSLKGIASSGKNKGCSNVLRQMNITSETMSPGLDGLARSMSCLRDAMGDYNAD